MDRKVFRDFFILNSIYAAYLLILLVLNYIKFSQDYHNAFWQTTEIWCFAILTIIYCGWRIPWLLHYLLGIFQNPVKQRISFIFALISALPLLGSYFFLRESESFELYATSVPLLYTLVSLGTGIVIAIIKGKSREKLLLLLPVIFLFISILNDVFVSYYFLPFSLYPYGMLLFQFLYLFIPLRMYKENRKNGKEIFLKYLSKEYNTSDRENELIGLLLDGLSKKIIADKLFISINTVKTHISNIYKKLEINSLNELYSLYYRK
ncbi:MAG: hypothetical protein JW866_04115 [Ignavibacteriales bacterium]|nr:hypothetical protein [Ignavibacteriales bacterium]